MSKHPNKRPIVQPAAPDAFVGRNTYVFARCPKHGDTAHLSYLGGRCCVCVDESLKAKGLVR